jgi:hypothetical protein
MILICVNNRTDDVLAGYAPDSKGYYNLTIGKSYEMIRDSSYETQIKKEARDRFGRGDPLSTLIKIQDDFGHIRFFPKHCFKSLDEIRDEKINLILDGK